MPPALEDDESDSGQEQVTIPVRKANGKKKAPSPEPYENEEEDEDQDAQDGGEEDQELDEDEFVVEKILGHKYDIKTNEIRFHVKWEGWSKPEDMTWEPEENLRDSAAEILADYFESKGGRDAVMEQTKAAIKGKKRGRPSASASTSTPPAAKRGRSAREAPPAAHPKDKDAGKAEQRWKPPTGSWEEEIDTIEACQDHINGGLLIYVTWRNGQKTQHPPSIIYTKAPQKMLQYYERHVKIVHLKRADDLDDSTGDIKKDIEKAE